MEWIVWTLLDIWLLQESTATRTTWFMARMSLTSDSRNERMVLKAVGYLGDSDHKYNPMALSQLAAAWGQLAALFPSNLMRSAPTACSYNEGGQLMANASVLPFGGAQSLEVAYGAECTSGHPAPVNVRNLLRT